ncbi:MAG: ParB N-terminal domain-containing protein [Candidatus Roizmanbacteria bacterium]|nr:ParB N-terminal domain-containing protein [Candidatus Roizmanbacteria bacterium]
MKRKIYLLDIKNLKNHEMISIERLKQVKDDLLTKGYIKNPVVVEKENHIILDGHHRVAALKQLGAIKVPTFLVNYQDKDVRVFLRRKLKLAGPIKQSVIKNSLSNILFPSKTTKHLIKNRPRNINIKISNLFNKD